MKHDDRTFEAYMQREGYVLQAESQVSFISILVDRTCMEYYNMQAEVEPNAGTKHVISLRSTMISVRRKADNGKPCGQDLHPEFWRGPKG